MKKIFGLMLCLAFVSMVFASHADRPDIAKEIKDPNPPQYVEGVMRSTGGPDDFGYEWIDSNEPGGPVYSWIEINATGTNMNLTDDSHFWPIPFNFDFYGVTYNNIAAGQTARSISRIITWDLLIPRFPAPTAMVCMSSLPCTGMI